jgi:threonine dehydrogenase-like Zn-dependent dehydrogenase
LEVEVTEPAESDKIKVRITHILPSLSDVNIFSGDSSTAYPFIIGHSAIGVISDDRPEYGLKRGTKVILDPYACTADDPTANNVGSCISTKGVDEDGFMREFIFMDKEKIIPFPEEVDENEAIFTEKIALALKVINSYRMEKGDYIVIIGGNSFCNILGQLAIYFQLVPIMIDGSTENLARAQACGIYYVINEAKESALDKIKEITCDRMAENTVLAMNPDVSPEFAFPMTKIGGRCVIVCENKVMKRFDADISTIGKRQIRVCGVNNGASEFDSAINILAQKILNFDGFIDRTVETKDAEILLRELKENPERYYNAIIRI